MVAIKFLLTVAATALYTSGWWALAWWGAPIALLAIPLAVTTLITVVLSACYVADHWHD